MTRQSSNRPILGLCLSLRFTEQILMQILILALLLFPPPPLECSPRCSSRHIHKPPSNGRLLKKGRLFPDLPILQFPYSTCRSRVATRYLIPTPQLSKVWRLWEPFSHGGKAAPLLSSPASYLYSLTLVLKDRSGR